MTPPAPIPLEEAQSRLLDAVTPLGSDTIRVEQAMGRYLAAQPRAQRSQPAADLSAMDGYATREDDLEGPWQVIGESAAGTPFDSALEAGQAVRIFTGAHMPANGGAVLLQENAAREGDTLRPTEGQPDPRHIRRSGFDFASGDPLLDAGLPLTPARIALLLTAGHTQVEVGRMPSLAVLDNGDELTADPANCAPHQIPASNGAMLAAMASPFASRTERIGPVPDRMEALLEALDRSEAHDVLVTSGGASVGDHDLVRPALERWGARIDFWRVAIKPGKPLMVARRGEQWVLGLPGNPVSSFVTAHLFLLPLLRKLGGAADPLPPRLTLPLAVPLPATGDRMEFVRGRYETDGVHPLRQQDSSALASLAASNCLIRRPARSQAADAGEVVEILPT